jgi:hypothetical protein
MKKMSIKSHHYSIVAVMLLLIIMTLTGIMIGSAQQRSVTDKARIGGEIRRTTVWLRELSINPLHFDKNRLCSGLNYSIDQVKYNYIICVYSLNLNLNF